MIKKLKQKYQTGKFSLRKSELEQSTSMGNRKVSLDPEFHFFSDTELTVQMDSRPNTPTHAETVLSDTEFEVKKSKGNELIILLLMECV